MFCISNNDLARAATLPLTAPPATAVSYNDTGVASMNAWAPASQRGWGETFFAARRAVDLSIYDYDYVKGSRFFARSTHSRCR
jgi:hypothetical protein